MKKKTLVAVVMVCAMLFTLCIMNISAEKYEYLTYTVLDGEVTITDCDYWTTSVEIPNEIAGYPVTSIGENTFSSCRSLTNITVDSNNQYYSSENGIFYDKEKTKLICYPAKKEDTSYTIPDSVTNIETYAFYYCNSLSSVTISDSVTSIGEYAFYNCSSLTNITIPGGVTSIGEYAFYYCYSLTSITVDSNNQYYSSENGVLFDKAKTKIICYPCGKGDASYMIPENVVSIGEYAFSNCIRLTSITIGSSVTSIGNRAFSSCSNITIVNYIGVEAQWNEIEIQTGNDSLINVARNYFTNPINSEKPVKTQTGYNINTILIPKKIAEFETATLFVALYNGDKFIGIGSATVTNDTTTQTIGVETDSDATEVRLLLWDADSKPLCESSETSV